MERVFIGIDVSKGHADFSIVNEKKIKIIDNFKLFDNATGHITLINILKKFKSKSPNLIIYCAMESTGRYETHWNDLLTKYNELADRVYIVNGFNIKHYHKSFKEKNKTDSISSFVIAHYLTANYNNLTYNIAPTVTFTREIVKSINLIDKSIVEATNRLRMEAYVYFPEFSSILEEHLSAWHLNFLLKYPTSFHAKYGKIKSMKKIRYANGDLIETIKRQISMAIRPLGDKAKNDIGGQKVIDLVRDIILFRDKKEQYFTQLKDGLNSQQVDLLISIPGIGRNSALQLLALVGDVQRFTSAKKLASYFGVHPVLQNSGNVVRSRMSKKGNPLGRKLLFSVALQMTRPSSPLYFLFKQYTEQMSCKMKAIGKCMHLAIRVIWSILYNEQLFNIEKFIKQHTRRGAKIEYATSDFTQLLSETNNDFTAPLSAKKKKDIRNKIRKEMDKKKDPKTSQTTVSIVNITDILLE